MESEQLRNLNIDSYISTTAQIENEFSNYLSKTEAERDYLKKLELIHKLTDYTAFEVTPTNKDFKNGDSWCLNIDDVDEWNSAKLYKEGTFVSYDEKIYICYLKIDGGDEALHPDIDAEHWKLYSSVFNTWDGTKSYEEGTLVSYEGKIYFCRLGVSKSETTPNNDSSHWSLYTSIDYDVKSDIIADDIHVVTIRNYNKQSTTDIIVDWGDGTLDVVKDLYNEDVKGTDVDPKSIFSDGTHNKIKTLMTFSNSTQDNVEHFISLAHKYEIPNGQDRAVYQIKIYGTYWGIIHAKKSPGFTVHNLISRVIDWDLPLSKNLLTLSNGFEGANRLFVFKPLEYTQIPGSIINFVNMFKNCKNLQEINCAHKGKSIFNGSTSCPVNVNTIFAGCDNVSVMTGFRAPIYIDEYCNEGGDDGGTRLMHFKGTYSPKKDISIDILDIFPRGGFANKILNFNRAFYNMSKITCSNYEQLAHILWENPGYTGKECFTGCTSMKLDKIPKEWGGTLDAG